MFDSGPDCIKMEKTNKIPKDFLRKHYFLNANSDVFSKTRVSHEIHEH